MANEAGTVFLRIGAGIDSSVESSFSKVERRAERAGRAVNKNLGRGTGAGAGGGASPYAATERAHEASLRRMQRASAAADAKRGREAVARAERTAREEQAVQARLMRWQERESNR